MPASQLSGLSVQPESSGYMKENGRATVPLWCDSAAITFSYRHCPVFPGGGCLTVTLVQRCQLCASLPASREGPVLSRQQHAHPGFWLGGSFYLTGDHGEHLRTQTLGCEKDIYFSFS